MRDRHDELGDAEVVVVVHARQRTLRGYRARFVAPLRVVTDEAMDAYRAFGFGLAEDGSQLGGDVVIDADGRIALLYAQRTSSDRPPVDDLIVAVRAAR